MVETLNGTHMCFVVDEEIYDGNYCVMIILNL